MIHHLSIAADNLRHVAQVLAKLLDGKIMSFPSLVEPRSLKEFLAAKAE